MTDIITCSSLRAVSVIEFVDRSMVCPVGVGPGLLHGADVQLWILGQSETIRGLSFGHMAADYSHIAWSCCGASV